MAPETPPLETPEQNHVIPEIVPETKPETPQTPPEPKEFDPASISPEAKAYFEQKYSDYDKHKGMAQEYDGLIKTKEFQEWYQAIRTPKAPAKFEISDDQFTRALSSKEDFAALVEQLAERKASEKFGPEIQRTQFQLDAAKRTDELNRSVKRHDGSDGFPAFLELDKRGFVEPYLRSYPGISFEDAYKLALTHVLTETIDKKARGLVDERKGTGTERPSAGNTRGSKVRVRTTEEAMEIAYDAAKAGKPEPEFEFVE